jgi:hypothetical protein
MYVLLALLVVVRLASDLLLLPQVPSEAFVIAANSMKRQITPEVLARFRNWRERNEGKGK